METHVSEDIVHEIWKKLLGNVSLSALSGLTDLSSASVNAIPELKSVSLKAMEEAFNVAQSCGVELDRSSVVKGIEMISQPGGTGDNKSSLCVDLLNGRKPKSILSTAVSFNGGWKTRYRLPPSKSFMDWSRELKQET